MSSGTTLKEMLRKTSIAFLNRDVKELKVVRDTCIYSLGLKQDNRFLSAAIMAYSLSKLVGKPRFFGELSESHIAKIKELLASTKYVTKEDELNRIVEEVIGTITEWENTDKRFAKSIIQKAKLKIAATLYAQGFSLKTTAELTGAEESELMSYIGNTLFADRLKEGLAMQQRIKNVEKLLE